jgi:hypothetical protein
MKLCDLESEKSGGTVDRPRKIRCPVCKWQPGRADRWSCTCGHVWNTFDTRAVCPACKYRWPYTQCRRCRARSPHEDWYE